MLQKFHRLSGLIIASFLLLHVSNHLFALAGPAAHIAAMQVLRYIYRFPPIEILLLACVLFQIATGLVLVLKKKFWSATLYDRLQVLSGLYLSFFMVIHVWAVLTGRYVWHVETDFYFAAAVANRYPEKLFFIPYYTLSLVSAFVHIACVHRAKMMQRREVTQAYAQRLRWQTRSILWGGFIITTLIILSLTGVFYTIG
jgi:succinate dehydrogenase/fumarate reductase cytochrome b subunit